MGLPGLLCPIDPERGDAKNTSSAQTHTTPTLSRTTLDKKHPLNQSLCMRDISKGSHTRLLISKANSKRIACFLQALRKTPWLQMGTGKVREHRHTVPSYHTLRMIANSWWNLVPNSSTNKITGSWIIIKSPTILTSTSDLLRVCTHTAHVPIRISA